jgi:osmotically-inducible protein OsmY
MKSFLLIFMTAMLISCSSTESRESTGQYVDNSIISGKIKSKLISDSIAGGSSIDVESYKGIVILSGFVQTKSEKERALELARKTKGVKEVKDALYVKNEFSE